ncbi:MAG: hypothetical protein SGJ10_11310 [Bacteroidota bacterium]|nr:hypothetical protein [Bacteroidota bacterium]
MKKTFLPYIVCTILIVFSCRKDPVYTRAETSFKTGETDSAYFSDLNTYIPSYYNSFGNSNGFLQIDIGKDGIGDILISYTTSHSLGYLSLR